MLLIIFVATPVFGLPSFQNSPDGFRGIKWGDPPSTLGNYESLSGNDEYMKIYTRPDDKMRLGEVRLYNIYYIFYLDRFMGIHITTVSEYFSELKDISGACAFLYQLAFHRKPPIIYLLNRHNVFLFFLLTYFPHLLLCR